MWHCPTCNYYFSGEYEPHVPGSKQCKRNASFTICPEHGYGHHIKLECKGCRSEYSTKNIDRIGARSIFLVKKAATMCDHCKEFEHVC